MYWKGEKIDRKHKKQGEIGFDQDSERERKLGSLEYCLRMA